MTTPRRTRVTGKPGIYYRQAGRHRRYEVTFRDSSRRQRWETVPGFDNLADAEALRDDRRGQKRRGEPTPPAGVTFADVTARYLASPQFLRLAPTTRKTYSDALADSSETMRRFGRVKVATIDSSELARFVYDLKRRAKRNGTEGQPRQSTVLDRARFACPDLASVGADSGFAAERVWRGLERRRLIAYIPPQPTMLPTNGEPTSDAQREALAARARCKSEQGVWAHKQRMADAEGVIGELKNRHGLDRVRSRGTPLFHVQLLLGCAALNCKRIADHVPEAANGLASAPTAAARDLQPAAAGGRADHPVCGATADATSSAFTAPPTNWSYTVCLN